MKNLLIIFFVLLILGGKSINRLKIQENQAVQIDSIQIPLEEDSEFKIFNNGLIYSDRTMNKLKFIVDSLNLKFRNCNINKRYYSNYQTIGHLVKLDSGDIKSAKKDLENNISFDEFCDKHPEAVIEKHVLIVKYIYTNYENKKKISIEHFDLKSDYGFRIESYDLSLLEKNNGNKWLFEYNKKSEYSKESLESFYFSNDFKSIELPLKYSLKIGYADCLIDTNVNKFKHDAEYGDIDLPENWASLSNKEQLELLEKLRGTNVIGYCSMDGRPRQHAVNIALLSAETAYWEVFLRAHLDIMNDRFQRMSDGNYAWKRRNTYIKELEEININVIDLIMGISLRIDNPPSNHYYASISRTGRALSETKNRDEVESAILSAIADPDLDYHNRLIMYFLFKNYNSYTKDQSIKTKNKAILSKAAATLPSFFQKGLIDK